MFHKGYVINAVKWFIEITLFQYILKQLNILKQLKAVVQLHSELLTVNSE